MLFVVVVVSSRADAVVFVSNATRRDFFHLQASQSSEGAAYEEALPLIFNSSNGVSAAFRPMDVEHVRQRLLWRVYGIKDKQVDGG